MDRLETPNPKNHLRVRIVFGPDAMIGPGKAELLEHIRDTGSISAAGRAMDMSYKRAWMLVDYLNAAFREPLVDCTRGGAKGGGAVLTTAGRKMIGHYRALEEKAEQAGAMEIAALDAMLHSGHEGE